MGNRYDIQVWAEPAVQSAGSDTRVDVMYHAAVIDRRTGKEEWTDSRWRRSDVLASAFEQWTKLEEELRRPEPDSDISPDEAMRFARVFLDIIKSVNKSIDGFEIAYGYGIANSLEVRIYPLSDPNTETVRRTLPAVETSVGPGQDVTDVLETTLQLAKRGRS